MNDSILYAKKLRDLRSMNVTCNKCGYQSEMADGTEGKKIRCPKCQNVFICPSAQGFVILEDEVSFEKHVSLDKTDEINNSVFGNTQPVEKGELGSAVSNIDNSRQTIEEKIYVKLSDEDRKWVDGLNITDVQRRELLLFMHMSSGGEIPSNEIADTTSGAYNLTTERIKCYGQERLPLLYEFLFQTYLSYNPEKSYETVKASIESIGDIKKWDADIKRRSAYRTLTANRMPQPYSRIRVIFGVMWRIILVSMLSSIIYPASSHIPDDGVIEIVFRAVVSYAVVGLCYCCVRKRLRYLAIPENLGVWGSVFYVLGFTFSGLDLYVVQTPLRHCSFGLSAFLAAVGFIWIVLFFSHLVQIFTSDRMTIKIRLKKYIKRDRLTDFNVQYYVRRFIEFPPKKTKLRLFQK